jgi:hypothetical protein
MARPHLARFRQRQQPLVERAEDVAGARGLLDREVGTRDVAREQRVAAQDRPRRIASRLSTSANACARGDARRVARAHGQGAEVQLPAVVEGLVVVRCPGGPLDVDRRASRGEQTPVTGHVVGVVVRLHDVLDPHPEVAREAQVLVDGELGSTTAATPAPASPTR